MSGDRLVPIPCTSPAGLLSEGPRWHAERGELLWVDIIGAKMHRAVAGVDGALEPIHTIALDRHAGAVAPDMNGGYVVAATTGFLHVDPAGTIRELAQPDAGRDDVRMNDGACDAQGRFWAGTMAYDESPGAGVLYRLELDGSCTTVLTGLTISNGIGWSPDGATMYLSDSGTRRVDAFDFDASSGAITGRRTIVAIDAPGAAPDGLTVDEEGAIWVALWDGGAVHRYGPDGTLLCTVAMPVDRPTSCAFGGTDRSTLFVTTARHGLEAAALFATTRRRARISHRGSRRPRRTLRALPRTDLILSSTDGGCRLAHPPWGMRRHIRQADDAYRRGEWPKWLASEVASSGRPFGEERLMTNTVDELGPVDFLVVEFPANASNFTGEMATELARLHNSGTIKLLDLLVLRKDDDGSVEAFEIDDLAEVGELVALEAEIAEILAAEDVAHLAESMEPGSTAGVVVWENTWAAPFASAARRSGGQLVATGRIPIQAIIASLEADEASSKEGE